MVAVGEGVGWAWRLQTAATDGGAVEELEAGGAEEVVLGAVKNAGELGGAAAVEGVGAVTVVFCNDGGAVGEGGLAIGEGAADGGGGIRVGGGVPRQPAIPPPAHSRLSRSR